MIASARLQGISPLVSGQSGLGRILFFACGKPAGEGQERAKHAQNTGNTLL
jgi:hypothetical protein